MTLPFTTTFRVRYAETDQMGVAYHSNYLIWCEVGRVEFLRALGFSYKQFEQEDDCHLPVVEATCRYKAPARYDDELLIETTVTALRGHIIRFAYRIRTADTLLAEAATTHVVVDRTMKKRSLPERYFAALQATMNP
ncbi:acyl-CoA thioesterase [Acidipila rosea]|uniref:Acyl-CoA thioester hydrolase n=1 Tax=Acidipila rosea TaxID=768535 RepID=A0A4R1L8R2_9BACT|nr:thioesterase family protein [Acidipila rosea]TCK73677.1 acyl-CoA thioester hydrolase [Acidipila rosea]